MKCLTGVVCTINCQVIHVRLFVLIEVETLPAKLLRSDWLTAKVRHHVTKYQGEVECVIQADLVYFLRVWIACRLLLRYLLSLYTIASSGTNFRNFKHNFPVFEMIFVPDMHL